MDPFFVLVHSIQTLHVNQLMIDLNFHKNQSVTTTFFSSKRQESTNNHTPKLKLNQPKKTKRVYNQLLSVFNFLI